MYMLRVRMQHGKAPIHDRAACIPLGFPRGNDVCYRSAIWQTVVYALVCQHGYLNSYQHLEGYPTT